MIEILAIIFNIAAILGWAILIVLIFDAVVLDGQLVVTLLMEGLTL